MSGRTIRHLKLSIPPKSSDNAESSESSESSEVDDMLNAAEDSLKFEDELQGLLGNRAKVAVIITRLDLATIAVGIL